MSCKIISIDEFDNIICTGTILCFYVNKFLLLDKYNDTYIYKTYIYEIFLGKNRNRKTKVSKHRKCHRLNRAYITNVNTTT